MFQKFPFTNSHQLNLDWILKILKSLKGGATGQVLTKLSANNFDFNWTTPGTVPPTPGTTDYDDLANKPSINGVTLTGDKTSADLNITVRSPANFPPSVDSSVANGGTSLMYARGDHRHPANLLVATSSEISTLPVTIYNPNITKDHIVVNNEFQFSKPNALVAGLTWETFDGYIILSGSLEYSTTISFALSIPQNIII